MDYGMWLLGRSDMFEAKFLAKLISWATTDEEAHKILNRFKELGYIDDARLTERKMSNALEIGNKGLRRVTQDLMRQGAPKACIEQAVENIKASYTDSDEFDNCLSYAQRKYGQKPIPEERDARIKEINKRQRHLVGKGFGFDTVSKTMKALETKPEE